MDIKSVRHYLELLQMRQDYQPTPIACEICDSSTCLTLLTHVHGPQENAVALPVVGCTQCGHIYQIYRFDSQFYQDYYDKFYRLNLFGDSEPDKTFFLDQIKRGNYLYKNLSSWLPKQGYLIDVGCSAGGLMIPFAKRGWQVKGNDPDSAYAQYGKKLGLNIDTVSAEDMATDELADLIIINGSLEHVYDVNRVMEKCRAMAADQGLLLIEGRALGYGMQQGYLTHNHRRFLTPHSIELLMLKHGWTPVLTTETPLCGPTRPGAVFVLGRASHTDSEVFVAVSAAGRDRLQRFYRPWFDSVGAA
ncbi:class I SAM-dependent methyltransferase [Xenorhabdus sp. 12]|uniref:Class I SAM-dependent methyltransferase n=1 Tax=Xenorhabdus santafensis TaxID=2582833 RepID=A0ABU4S6M3_9GAMM|nr:class I SAM-dependent methyltransferase [Xenorhabdus sp. 12]MDX7986309.1 class I SAM-dependent methyltransferase [Xenorhabdus sp. 12]